MNNILAIETTGPRASVAFCNGEGIVSSLCGTYELRHLETLMPMIEKLIGSSKAAPTEIAISAGPGSFTGIRIGVATARALSQNLDLPLIKVPTLETFVYLAKNEDGDTGHIDIVCPIFDARRGQMYAGAYYLDEDDEIVTLVPGGAYFASEYTELLEKVLPAFYKYIGSHRKTPQSFSANFAGDGVGEFREAILTWSLFGGSRSLCGEADFCAGCDGSGSRCAIGTGASLQVKFTEDMTQDAAAVLSWARAFGVPAAYGDVEPIYMRQAEAQRKIDEAGGIPGILDKINIGKTGDTVCKSGKSITEPDARAISSICKLSLAEPWTASGVTEDMANEFSLYLVAKLNDNVIAFVGAHLIGGEGEISNIAVHPSFRNRGIGGALLSELMSMTEAQGITDWTLEVRSGDESAIRFYERLGFAREGSRKDFYPAAEGKREDADIMWRRTN